MFCPQKMSKINVLVLGRHLNRMTSALGESGLVHLIDATTDKDGKMLTSMNLEDSVHELEELLSRVEALLENLGIEKDYQVPEMGEITKEDIIALIAKVEALYQEQNSELVELVKRKTSLVQSDVALSSFPFQSMRIESLRNLAHLYVTVGTMEEDGFLRARQALQEDAWFVSDESSPRKVLVLSTRKKRFSIDENLSKFGFVRFELPENVNGSISEERNRIKDDIDELKTELEAARRRGLHLGDVYGGPLLAVKNQLHTLLFLGNGQKFFAKSRQLYRISGWIPDGRYEELQEIVDMATDGTGVVEKISAEQAAKENDSSDETIPVLLGNGAVERSFHLLVTTYGTPNYHEIDPSLFTGITFVLMFGYMFGDIGQGAVLAICGAIIKLRKSLSEATRDVGLLLFFCGLCAIGFGCAYGSFFGYENHEILSPLWLNPLEAMTIPQLLMTAVGMGVVFLSISLLMNIINHFRNKRFFQGVFDKYGLLGVLFYLGCLVTGATAFLGGEIGLWQVLLIAIPLMLLFLKEPIFNLIHHHRLTEEGSSLLDTFLGGAVELMETLTGYMSGTVSFVRVGAFAISHAALCMAVFSIVKMVKEIPMGSFWALIVIILGNILIIGFEGMVAAIQCIRLEYYEMYSRYFQGGGTQFRPFCKKE